MKCEKGIPRIAWRIPFTCASSRISIFPLIQVMEFTRLVQAMEFIRLVQDIEFIRPVPGNPSVSR